MQQLQPQLSQNYELLADRILGQGYRPFAEHNQSTSAAMWYKFSALSEEHALSEALASGVPEDSYILEVGSFIGNSAIEWARLNKDESYIGTYHLTTEGLTV
jgi:hypothetical protein